MADATTRLRAEKQDYDSNDDAWGTHLNAGVFDVLDQAIAGVIGVVVNANVTLDVQNFISDQARNAGLLLTGAGGFVVTVPAVQKTYQVVNLCAADVTIRPVGGAGSVIRAGTGATWLTDGATGRTIDNTLDKVKAPAAPVSMAGQRLTDLAAPILAGDAATKAYADAANDAVDDLVAEAQALADEAEDSAASAIGARDAALAALDAFDDRYLGAKASDPTLDNDGNALLVGALYWNTAASQLRVRSSSSWVPITVLPLATQAQAEAGTDNAAAMTALRTAQAISAQTNPRIIGRSQAWQSVIRALGTSYQNITSAAIVATMTFESTGTTQLAPAVAEVSSDNATWISADQGVATGINGRSGVSCIVPPNHYYRFRGNGASGTASPTNPSFTELR